MDTWDRFTLHCSFHICIYGNLSRNSVQKIWQTSSRSSLLYGKVHTDKISYLIIIIVLLQHLIPLPGFLFIYKNIWEHFSIATHSEPMALPIISMMGFNVEIPQMIFYLMCNVITQYLCIRSVYILTTECASLTVTLVVTLRKFVSLLFSILYFKNPFTIYHWLGTGLVFFGTLIFTEVVPRISEQMQLRKHKKE